MDATTLRLILIVLGAAFLFWLYRREQRRCAQHEEERASGTERREPQLGLDATAPADEVFSGGSGRRRGATRRKTAKSWPRAPERVEPRLEPVRAAPDEVAEPEPEPPAAAPSEPLIVQLYLVTREGIDGQAILAAAARHRLIAGERDIFHRYDYAGDAPRVLFSMANLVKPGSFPLRHAGMADFVTPGLAFFTQITGERDDLVVLEELLDTVTALAEELNAQIQDEHRQPFGTAERERLRARVRHWVETGQLE